MTVLATTRTDIAGYVDAIFLVYSLLIVVYVLLSMIFSLGARVPYSRFTDAILTFLRDVSEPFLGIFRRFIPLIGPLDLSPLVGLIVLNIVRVIVVNAIHG
ncbi:MAG: YggT family protein [Actinobacteria bacterium]|nr:MAG: YggT family protein [Actinomycetota bacterium]